MHRDVVSFLMQSCVSSNIQEVTCVHLPNSKAVYVLHGSHTFRGNCCLRVLIMTENGDVCAAEELKDLKEKENYVC